MTRSMYKQIVPRVDNQAEQQLRSQVTLVVESRVDHFVRQAIDRQFWHRVRGRLFWHLWNR